MPKTKPVLTNIFAQYCKSQGLPEPIPEYKFSKTRKWRIDYYFEGNGIKVALEVEGGIWMKSKDGKPGRHNRASGFIKDMEKYNALAMHGIFLLRVTPNNLRKMKTIEMIRNTLKIKKK